MLAFIKVFFTSKTKIFGANVSYMRSIISANVLYYICKVT